MISDGSLTLIFQLNIHGFIAIFFLTDNAMTSRGEIYDNR